MSAVSPRVAVVGFFPPPVTGQAMATERLASLLSESLPVDRVDLGVRKADDASAVRASRFNWRVATRVVAERSAWQRRVRPATSVLWTSIASSRWGTLRDALLTSSIWTPEQQVWGVVHHGNFSQAFAHPVRRILLRRTLGRLAGLVLLSERLRIACEPHLQGLPVYVIPNTLRPDAIATPEELALRRRERAGGIRLLFLSNMIPEKGYWDVLSAAARLQQEGVLGRAVFAGAWPSHAARAAFERKVARTGLGDVVDIVSAVYDPDVKRHLFLEADVFVLPSQLDEAQPLTIMEALATGTPVVTTGKGGIPDLLGAPEGTFVPTQAPEGIVQALHTLRHHESWLRASHAASERFATAFHPSRVRASWLHLLASRS